MLVDGDTTLWESVAIMVYLANQAGADLWPSKDPQRQVEVMRWISWDLCHWVRFTGQFYFEYQIKPHLLGAAAPDRAALESAANGLHKSAAILDAHLARHRFVANDTLSIADFCLGVLLPYSAQIQLPVAEYRNIQRWHGELSQLEGWLDPWPT